MEAIVLIALCVIMAVSGGVLNLIVNPVKAITQVIIGLLFSGTVGVVAAVVMLGVGIDKLLLAVLIFYGYTVTDVLMEVTGMRGGDASGNIDT